MEHTVVFSEQVAVEADDHRRRVLHAVGRQCLGMDRLVVTEATLTSFSTSISHCPIGISK
jgi:hypothetical protein